MPDTDLNELRIMLGGLIENVKGLRRDIEQDRAQVLRNQDKADKSRAAVHQRLDDVVLRLGHVESDVTGLKRDTKAIQEITDGVSTLQTKALGAKWLGYWLVRTGIVILTAAGWLVAFWERIVQALR